MTVSMGGIDAIGGRLSLSGEGAFWSAQLEFATDPGGDGRYVTVNDQIGPVLTGYIKGGVEFSGGVYRATVVARAANYRAKSRAVLPNDDPYSLFRDPDAPLDEATALAARASVVHWGRDMECALVDVVSGSGHINVGDNYIDGSLSISTADSMISEVLVRLTAEWQENRVFFQDFSGRIGTLQDGLASDEIWEAYGSKIGDFTIYQVACDYDPTPAEGTHTQFYRVDTSKNPAHSLKAPRTATQDKSRSHLLRLPRRFYDYGMKAVAVGNCKRRETMYARLYWAGSAAGIDGMTETVDLTVGNLDRGGQHPDWRPGFDYAIDVAVDMDGVSWKCIVPHTSENTADPADPDAEPTGDFYSDVEFWTPVENEATPIGGDFQDRFLSSAVGGTAVRFALNQALAKMRSQSRIFSVSFDVPWTYVRALSGTELVSVAGITGKVTSVDVDLVSGIASVSVKAVPYDGTVDQAVALPSYEPEQLKLRGVSQVTKINPYNVQESVLEANQYTEAKEAADVAREAQIKAQEEAGFFQDHQPDGSKSVQQIIGDYKTELEFVTPAVPRGKEYSVTIYHGDIGVVD